VLDPTRWRVEMLRSGESRSAARIAGATIEFSSQSTPLIPRAEAFLAPLLLSALHQGTLLQWDGSLDSRWLHGMREVVHIYSEWWGTPDAFPILHEGRIVRATPADGSRALCFTAGVDSFYELLRFESEVDSLLYVFGYDIELHENTRYQAFEPALHEIASHTGKTLHLMRSNLRAHPRFCESSWELTHGAALASAAILLAGRIRSLRIAASYSNGNHRPWGSSPRTDPLWSTSAVEIIHGDTVPRRFEKLRFIADDPLARRYLRVCHEHLRPGLNCSRCEKCLRTMASLSGIGCLETFITFDHSTPLPMLIDGLRFAPEKFLAPWEHLLVLDLPRDIRSSVTRLIDRSRAGARARLRRWQWARSHTRT
jgi:hypothetical protein